MAPSFTKDTTVAEVVTAYAPLIQGKTILTTGVTLGGLGGLFVETVAAANPKLLILAGRSASKLQETAAAISSKHPNVATRTLAIDLGSLKSVRKAAAEVVSWDDVPKIDVLMNNAAVMAVDFALTEDGFESQFAIGHIGHFLFTNLIMDKVLASEEPRIINVSSNGHRLSGIRWGDPNFTNGAPYNKWFAYGQAKTANMLFSISLAEKLGKRGLQSYSLHPGGIFSTALSSHLEQPSATGLGDFESLINADRTMGNEAGWWDWSKMGVTAEVGTATHAFAAFSPDLKDHNGKFLNQCRLGDPFTDTLRPWATCPFEAEMLWKLSEKFVGQEFTY